MRIAITGGTKGMGRAIAESFAEKGAEIAVAARNPKGLELMRTDFESRFPDVNLITAKADLSKKEEVLHFANIIKEQWDGLDILVNNAGAFIQDDLLTEPDGTLEKLLDINLMSAYHLSRALVPLMLEQGRGHLFNICSVASKQAFPRSGSYTVSKFAVLGLTKALRMELMDKNIKVTAILPGATYTSSWEGADIKAQRLIAPEDIARAVLGAWELGPSATVEEIVIRPQLGDL